jgi:tetratricopeptide (TPR) repeat protein
VAARPLVNLSLAVNYHFGQLNPRGYHVFNVAIHMLVAILLWAIVRRTLRLPSLHGRFDRAEGLIAVLVALLWAVHPLATEAVAYVTQRTELMMAMFYLATLYSSLRYWDAATPAARITWLVAAVLAALAGAASKEVIVSVPVIVLLFERTFLSRSFRDIVQRSWPLYLGLMASWVLVLALQVAAPRSDSAGFSTGLPAHVWWFTQAKVLLLYFKLVVWPWPLAIHYELPYLTTFGEAWLYLLPVALLAIATLILLWKRRAAGFLAACVFAVLAPTLVVPIPTEIAAERRMYLPLAALVAAAVVGGCAVWRRAALPKVAMCALALVLVLVASLVSARRLAAYGDPVVLWKDVLVHQPGDFIAHNNFGKALLETDRPEQALTHFQRAVELEPEYIDALFNCGNVLAQLGRLEEAAAAYERAVKLRPEFPEAWANLAAVYSRLGRPVQALAAAEHGLEAARSTNQSAAAERIDAWLKDYRAWLAGQSDQTPADSAAKESPRL